MQVSLKYVVERDGKVMVVCDSEKIANMFKNDGDEVRSITYISDIAKLENNIDNSNNAIEQLPNVRVVDNPSDPMLLWGDNTKCSKCGLEINHVTGYCCSRVDCPTGLGPTIC